jgi:anti-sigma B factor antagonist
MALLTFTRTVGPALVFELHGALDGTTADKLSGQIADAIDSAHRLFLFDLARLSFVSSAGLGVFLVTHRRLQPLGGRLRFAALQDSVRLVFKITALEALVEVYNTLEDALVGPVPEPR